ncbi:hypothetical protein Afil01_07010 [Actinorhabdospora filicis]|uniref:Uncharacterized protein n=1 Tax=Actinorhabdospora filicis TaxID=1785913 RepID=A0A9W6SI38_9ACTN|nr:hypothetical protein [Actinorhabdospora filicis]GLZ75894.1 hypothetical protein Afil01_07010 [Actinorhabdospora filicis]
MPGENPRDAYKSATQTLSRTFSGRREQQERLQKKHREDVAAIRARVGETLAARDAAAKSAAEASAKVDDIDERAGALWRDLLGYVGSGRIPPRLRDIGEAPRAIEARGVVRKPKAPRVPDPMALLERARKTLALARRGQLEFPPPRYLVALMALIGAVCGLAAVIGAQAILDAAGGGDGNKALVLRPLALVCVFLGPFIGLPLASIYLGWRHRQRPRQHHIWLLIGSGVVALVIAVPLLML